MSSAAPFTEAHLVTIGHRCAALGEQGAWRLINALDAPAQLHLVESFARHGENARQDIASHVSTVKAERDAAPQANHDLRTQGRALEATLQHTADRLAEKTAQEAALGTRRHDLYEQVERFPCAHAAFPHYPATFEAAVSTALAEEFSALQSRGVKPTDLHDMEVSAMEMPPPARNCFTVAALAISHASVGNPDVLLLAPLAPSLPRLRLATASLGLSSAEVIVVPTETVAVREKALLSRREAPY
ncbi:hypothetical protein DYB32_009421 [Aphanomyces invadans]|uniref:Uncharacterized protein n=1 Tax=Aphanomyces invadans TaxID=157072 RepID=A0A3R6YSH6_9STRA|nr:hypothetical protein DYB32_009421 [Aphanomyces invadans]